MKAGSKGRSDSPNNSSSPSTLAEEKGVRIVYNGVVALVNFVASKHPNALSCVWIYHSAPRHARTGDAPLESIRFKQSTIFLWAPIVGGGGINVMQLFIALEHTVYASPECSSNHNKR